MLWVSAKLLELMTKLKNIPPEFLQWNIFSSACRPFKTHTRAPHSLSLKLLQILNNRWWPIWCVTPIRTCGSASNSLSGSVVWGKVSDRNTKVLPLYAKIAHGRGHFQTRIETACQLFHSAQKIDPGQWIFVQCERGFSQWPVSRYALNPSALHTGTEG